MDKRQQYNDEIEEYTLEIETNFPELYHLLDETPYKGVDSDQPISNKDLEDYLNSLKDQLQTFKNKKKDT